MSDLLSEIREVAEAAGGRLRIGYPRWLRPFLMRGVIGVTLGRTVYLSPRVLKKDRDGLMSLLRHELTHVAQMRRLGLIRFLLRYGSEYVAHRRRGLSSHEAYTSISFEREALAAEAPPRDEVV
jgi:hypothetical protein